MNKESLAKTLCEVLELPICGRQGEAYRIITAVVEALTETLLRGETVKVDGFGIFKVYETPPTRRLAYFYPYLKRKGLHWEILEVPAKKKIIFTPSKALKRYINT